MFDFGGRTFVSGDDPLCNLIKPIHFSLQHLSIDRKFFTTQFGRQRNRTARNQQNF